MVSADLLSDRRCAVIAFAGRIGRDIARLLFFGPGHFGRQSQVMGAHG
jgi:hypothetical protein